jgi:hypothetical protein
MVFYQRLTNVARARHIRVVAATQEDLETNKKYLASHNVLFDAVVSRTENKISTPGTPTLLIVSPRGSVLGSWVGHLAPEQEKVVIEALLKGYRERPERRA